MRTKDKLAEALIEAGAPDLMVGKAREGEYDAFESKSATLPIMDLIRDCNRFGLEDLAKRAISGEFDGTSEEAKEWFKKLKGE